MKDNEIELVEKKVSEKMKALAEAQKEVNKIRDRATLMERNETPLDVTAAKKAFDDRNRLSKEFEEASRKLIEVQRKYHRSR